MALSAVGFGAPQFYRGNSAQAVPQRSFTQQSKDLSDAVNALRSPSVMATSSRASAALQMTTLCLVQPSDDAAGSGTNSLNNVISSYATVLSD